MKKKALFLLIPILYFQANAQEYNWSEDIASIIYNNCSSCHHEGGIAPFNLMTYTDMSLYSWQIHHVIDDRSMPPWPADPEYRHFVGEKVLEQSEIDALHWWLDNDMPVGDEDLAPPAPIFLPSGSLLDTIDYTVAIEPYTLQTNVDEYRWFVIENPFDEPFYISKLEVIAGLENVVHHADLFLDYTGISQQYDDADPLSGFNSSTGSPVNNHYINAWQPGGNVAEYPQGWGVEVLPDADLVIEIHFGPGGIGQIDDTKMNLQFVKNTSNVRPVNVGWLLYDSPPVLIDGPLIIPANEVTTFHQVSAPLQNDISLISICPHMHFLGKSYKVWFESPEGEEVPLINIPHWDFHWQKYYTFQQIQKVPAGSILKSEGVYDNTSNNHDNPFDPPQTAYSGSTTLDEMFLCYFIYAPYQSGDENIVMDSSILISTPNIELGSDPSISVFPNPANDLLYLQGNLGETSKVTFRIYNTLGEIMYQSIRPNKGLDSIEMFDIKELASGLYYLDWGNGARNFVVE